MRTGIVTLPLHTNYGGVLQAFALQKVLRDLGHEPVLIQPEEIVRIPHGVKALLIYLRRFISRALTGKPSEIQIEKKICRELPLVASNVQKFISERMTVTRYRNISDAAADSFNAFIAGSDQIWRPAYSHRLEDAFLGFAAKKNVRRVAYAASFGVDYPEYSQKQRKVCGALLSGFDAVSVREQSGVALCKEMLGAEACCMPDPTMLLTSDTYASIADTSDAAQVFAYILDKSPETLSLVEKLSQGKYTGLFNKVDPRGRAPLSERIQPSIEKWLGGIKGAEYVITDSFHACVFSIIFHKNFYVLANKGRGLSRIESLLEEFGLKGRLVTTQDSIDGLDTVDWTQVDLKLAELRQAGRDFLEEALK